MHPIIFYILIIILYKTVHNKGTWILNQWRSCKEFATVVGFSLSQK